MKLCITLTECEWAALTMALGQYLGQMEYMAKPDNTFSTEVINTVSIVDKITGAQFTQGLAPSFPSAIRRIADKEKGLWKKMDGKSK